MEKRQLELAERQLQGLVGLLSLQFILGVLLTTIINYNPHKHGAVQTTFLVMHIIVAAGLFGLAIFRVITAFKWGYQQAQSLIGLLGIVDALISGGIAAATGNTVAVFMMAIGMVVAFAAYGNSSGALARRLVSKK